MDAYGSFRSILKDQLNFRGMTQKQLAGEIGTTESTISRYISGIHTPDITVAAKIAEALGVSVDYLCGLTDIPSSKESLGAENLSLMRCYNKADDRDKKVIWAILEIYLER